jgi:ATP-dependent RNA helicase DDX27
MTSLPVQFTIHSDDEIEPEEEEEVEVFEPKKSNKQKNFIHIDFDTGDFPIVQKKKQINEVREKKPERKTIQAAADSVTEMTALNQRIALSQKKKKTKDQEDKPTNVAEEPEDSDADDAAGGGMRQREEQEFFDEVVSASQRNGNEDNNYVMFSQLGLSRPFLRSIEAMGYVQPTPIQERVIPFALAGRDICASAATGSGKTAAFALPFLERLLFRPKDISTIRVLVITPTRELATQIHTVVTQLAQYTDITCALICGGKKDVRSQEATLRQGPDIVVCTPGRMLDHLRNGRGVNVDDLDVLVLDEADRLLELGFQEEVEEVVKYCPISRQTLLFSATMTATVQDLIKLSLRRPVRVKTEANNQASISSMSSSSSGPGASGDASSAASKVAVAYTPERLVQEFVKIKHPSGSEAAQLEQEAILLSLLCHSGFRATKTIVFCELKRSVRRLAVLVNLIMAQEDNEEGGLSSSAVALHGDLSQPERNHALEAFRHGQAMILVATDVAARGLDIPGVQTVINAEMPRQLATYIHRIGRTARAGKAGRAITLVSDDRRKTLKEILKAEAGRRIQNGSNEATTNSNTNILSRKIASGVIQHYTEVVVKMEDRLSEAMLEERARQKLLAVEREAERAQNLLEYAEEIGSRPQRTWFRSSAQTQALRAQTKAKALGLASSDRDEPRAVGDEEVVIADADAHDEAQEETAVKERKLNRKQREKIHDASLSMREKLEKMVGNDQFTDFDLERKREARKSQRDETFGEKSLHRLSRRKRRRQEALAASKEFDEEQDNGSGGRRGHHGDDGEDGEDDGHKAKKSKPNASLSAGGVKAVAKKAKQQVLAKEQDFRNKSAGELMMRKIRIEEPVGDEEGGKKRVRVKVVRQSRAVGGLDFADSEWATSSGGEDIAKRMSKKKLKKLEQDLSFSDFDPTKKLRKGGKAGTNSFKSKKKFKRR